MPSEKQLQHRPVSQTLEPMGGACSLNQYAMINAAVVELLPNENRSNWLARETPSHLLHSVGHLGVFVHAVSCLGAFL